jgi:hypothetical protein
VTHEIPFDGDLCFLHGTQAASPVPQRAYRDLPDFRENWRRAFLKTLSFIAQCCPQFAQLIQSATTAEQKV